MNRQESSRYAGQLQTLARRAFHSSLVAGSLVAAAAQGWAFQGSAGGTQSRPGGASPAGGSQPLSAPEINPALIVGAVVLLVGGLLILTSRRRRPAKP